MSRCNCWSRSGAGRARSSLLRALRCCSSLCRRLSRFSIACEGRCFASGASGNAMAWRTSYTSSSLTRVLEMRGRRCRIRNCTRRPQLTPDVPGANGVCRRQPQFSERRARSTTEYNCGHWWCSNSISFRFPADAVYMSLVCSFPRPLLPRGNGLPRSQFRPGWPHPRPTTPKLA